MSDVDVLVVLEDDMDGEIADALRSIAYDVMLEYGLVVELHVLSETEFEHAQTRGSSFIENVTRDARIPDTDTSGSRTE